MTPETQRLRHDNLVRLMRSNVWTPERRSWWRVLWEYLSAQNGQHVSGVGGKAMWAYVAVALLIALGDSF